MSDLGILLRRHIEAAGPPLDIEALIDEFEVGLVPTRERRRRRWVVALAAAVVVLVVLGGLAAAIRYLVEEAPVLEEPTPTTVPELPDESSGGSTFASFGLGPDVGLYPAMAQGPEGLPVVAYFDATDDTLKLATCLDQGCEQANHATLADLLSGARPIDGHPPARSVAVTPAGRVVVAYQDGPDIMIASCDDAACTGTAVTRFAAGRSPSLTIGPSGLPVVAFEARFEVVVASCDDVACSNAAISSLGRGRFPALLIGPGDSLLIAYAGEGDILTVATCDLPCSAVSSQNVLDSRVDAVPSVALGTDGLPVISYVSAGGLDLAKCLDFTCESASSASIDSENVETNSIAVPADGNPVIMYRTFGDFGALRFAKCADQSCTQTTITSLARFIGSASMQLGSDGRALIAYYNTAAGDLVTVRCGETGCAPPPQEPTFGKSWTVAVLSEGPIRLGSGRPRLELGPDGAPIVVYTGETTTVVRCLDPMCESRTATSLGDADQGDRGHSLGVGAGGEVYVSYLANDPAGGNELRLVSCGNDACSAGNVESVVDVGSFAFPGRLAVGPTGLPVVTFKNLSAEADPLRMATCSDPDCASGVTVTQLMVGEVEGSQTSVVAVPEDGFPVIAVQGPNGLTVVKCEDPACVGQITAVIDSDMKGENDTLRIEIAPDGYPIIAYHADRTFKVAKCLDPECSQPEINVVAQTGPIWNQPSIGFTPEGSPVLAFWGVGRVLTIAVCQDNACGETSMTAFDSTVGNFTMVLDEDGFPVVAFYRDGGLQLARCTDPACLSG